MFIRLAITIIMLCATAAHSRAENFYTQIQQVAQYAQANNGEFVAGVLTVKFARRDNHETITVSGTEIIFLIKENHASQTVKCSALFILNVSKQDAEDFDASLSCDEELSEESSLSCHATARQIAPKVIGKVILWLRTKERSA